MFKITSSNSFWQPHILVSHGKESNIKTKKVTCLCKVLCKRVLMLMCTTHFSDVTHFEGLMFFCEFEFPIRLLTPMTSLKTLPQRSINLKNDKVYNLLIFHILEVQSNVTAETKAPRGYEPTDTRHQFLVELPEAKGVMTSLHWQIGLKTDNIMHTAHRTLC